MGLWGRSEFVGQVLYVVPVLSGYVDGSVSVWGSNNFVWMEYDSIIYLSVG
jgi:hypothetical protein